MKVRIILVTAVILVCILAIIVGSKYSRSRAQTLACREYLPCPDCNVLLLTIDSFRNDHIHAMGYNRETTPNLDAFIKDSYAFTNYFTTSFLTPITQMSLHTGMYPSSNGMVLFNSIIPDHIPTLAEILKTDAFTTVALHTAPEYFDEPGTKISFSRGFDWYQHLQNRSLSPFTVQSIQHEIASQKNNRFFLWTSIGSVHWPYGLGAENIFADPDYNGIFKNQLLRWELLTHVYDGILYPGTVMTTKSIDFLNPAPYDSLYVHLKNTQSKVTLTEKDLQYVIDMYDNGIRRFDDFFGTVIQTLKDNGLYDKTIIIVTSEHGEPLHEKKYFAHYDIYDTLIHTPLIIHTPKATQPLQIDGLISTVDVLPTLLALLGKPIPKQVQGINYLPTLCEEVRSDLRNYVFTERQPLWEQCVYRDSPLSAHKDYIEDLKDENITHDISIRSKKWKYILRRSNEVLEKISWWTNLIKRPIVMPEAELYDIENDPSELQNVADTHPEVTEDLNKKLLDWWDNISKTIDLDSRKKTIRIQEYF